MNFTTKPIVLLTPQQARLLSVLKDEEWHTLESPRIVSAGLSHKLSTRVGELIKKGYQIEKKMTDVWSPANGKTIKVRAYRLIFK